jgi:hypothetical protein
MTRLGTTILLVGLLIVGLGGAGYLLPFLVPLDAARFEAVVLALWGLGGALALAGAVLAGVGKARSR